MHCMMSVIEIGQVSDWRITFVGSSWQPWGSGWYGGNMVAKNNLLYMDTCFLHGKRFVIYEQAVTQSEYQRTLQFVIGSAARSGPLADKIQADIVGARHDVWANLLLTFFRYPQAIVMVIVIGMIAPRAISFDLGESRTFSTFRSRLPSSNTSLASRWSFGFTSQRSLRSRRA